MIRILSKARLMPDEMQDKKDRDSDFCEIHLMREFQQNTPEEIFEQAERRGCFEMMDIRSIHSPLYEGRDCYIERVADRYEVECTCKLAQLIAEKLGHEIVVVVHVPTHPRMLKYMGVLDVTLDFARGLLDEYENIVLALEIHAPYDYQYGDISIFPTCSIALNEKEPSVANIELAKLIDHPRCIALMDTCHMRMFQRWLANMGEFLEDEEISEAAESFMEDVFLQAIPYCRHIHVARAGGHGFGPGRHGQPFTNDIDEQRNELREQMEILIGNGFEGNIVLEVYEDDYLDSVNFENTLETITNILDEMNVEYEY